MSKLQATVNGRVYSFPEYVLINEEVRKLFESGEVLTSNGCGTNWFNKILIGMLESWAKIDLVKLCIIHDFSYELADHSVASKIKIDAEFHINIYNMCMDVGISRSKARRLARLFHMAVLTAGPDSYSYNDD